MKQENNEVTLLQSKVAEMEQTINLLQHQVTHQEVWLDGSEIKIKFKIIKKLIKITIRIVKNVIKIE